jgi:hypothetical protein
VRQFIKQVACNGEQCKDFKDNDERGKGKGDEGNLQGMAEVLLERTPLGRARLREWSNSTEENPPDAGPLFTTSNLACEAAAVEGGGGRSARARSRLADQLGPHVGAKVYLDTEGTFNRD